MAYVDRPFPASGLEGKFSLQYTLAAALLDGGVGVSTFSDERLRRPDMQELLARTQLLMSPDRVGRFEEMEVLVEVVLADGRTVRRTCAGPPGQLARPTPHRRRPPGQGPRLPGHGPGRQPDRALRGP